MAFRVQQRFAGLVFRVQHLGFWVNGMPILSTLTCPCRARQKSSEVLAGHDRRALKRYLNAIFVLPIDEAFGGIWVGLLPGLAFPAAPRSGVQGLGVRVWSLGSRVKGLPLLLHRELKLRDDALRLRVWGLEVTV